MDTVICYNRVNATVVELVDTRDSKSLFRKKVSVRVRSVVFESQVYSCGFHRVPVRRYCGKVSNNFL